MDNLRWVLLVLGIVIVAVVYLFSRFELWGKLIGFKQQFQQKTPQGPDVAAKRGSVRFDDTDEIFLDDEYHSSFAVSEFTGDVPVIHAEDEELQVTTADWQQESLEEQAGTETLITAEDLHEEGKKNDIPVLNKPLETEVEPLSFDTPEASREEDLPSNVEPLVLALSIISNDEHWFQGAVLKKALEAEGLSFGAMEIFHYFHAGKKPAIFSAASVLEPGIFELESMENSSIPGLTLFCQLPGVLSATDAFDCMLSCARNLAAQLHGKVCDDQRNTLTSQVIRHYQDQITTFDHKLMLAKNCSFSDNVKV